MRYSFTVQRLSAGSIYKIIAIGSACSFVPLILLMGILGLLGASTVKWNNQTVTGVAALASSAFIAFFFVIFFTLIFGTMCAVGLWLYSKFNSLQLTVEIPAPEKQQQADKADHASTDRGS